MRKNTADTKRRASTPSSLRLKEVLELAATVQRDRHASVVNICLGSLYRRAPALRSNIIYSGLHRITPASTGKKYVVTV